MYDFIQKTTKLDYFRTEKNPKMDYFIPKTPKLDYF